MSMNLAPIVANFEREGNGLLNRSHQAKVETVNAVEKWTPVFIWPLTVAEMVREGVSGQQVCFHALLSVIGTPIWEGPVDDSMGLGIRFGWDGMRTEETPTLGQFEKRWPEPPGNVAMYPGAEYWFEIADQAKTPSDRVTKVTLTNPDDGADQFAHHAWLIVWQLQRSTPAIVVPPVRPDSGYATVPVAKLRDAQVKAKAFYDSLMALG